MKLAKKIYEKRTGKPAPYYYDYSIFTIIGKPLRKFVAQVLAPNCPFNNLRICLYRLCGFQIGKGTFIGMKCYLDDMCYDLLKIGDHVTVSYGVYFACHGKNQGHYPIEIEDGAYVGMRSSIISNTSKNQAGGINQKRCNRWCLRFGQQGCSEWSDSYWRSLQNNRKNRFLTDCEVSAA